jgi:hypothetical protein
MNFEALFKLEKIVQCSVIFVRKTFQIKLYKNIQNVVLLYLHNEQY